jgi:hypothetical protein
MITISRFKVSSKWSTTQHMFNCNFRRSELACFDVKANSMYCSCRIYIICNISNPSMRTGIDFKSAQFDGWNLIQSELEDLKWHLIRINHYLKWGELILIQSKDWINVDRVLGLDQYTSPGIQYYHVNKIEQYGWLIGNSSF